MWYHITDRTLLSVHMLLQLKQIMYTLPQKKSVNFAENKKDYDLNIKPCADPEIYIV